MKAQALSTRKIACIDMRSFYASCAAIQKGLDLLQAYIVVVRNQERKGSVMLAASPLMKKEFGVRTGTRLFEIPDEPRILLIEPEMKFFLRVSIEEVTNETMKIYKVCQELSRKFHQDKPVRQISLSITNLEDESSMQLSLFEERKWQKRKIGAAMDVIREKYGYAAVYRGISRTVAGTAIARTQLIGGHKK